VAAFITVAMQTVPEALSTFFWRSGRAETYSVFVQHNFWHLAQLALALPLGLASPRRNGLRIGEIRASIPGTMFVCILPLFIAAIVLPRLSSNPFAGGGVGVWLFGPLAQDFVFIGYLYGRFESLFPGFVHPRLPIGWPLVVTGVFFSAHHIFNLFDEGFSVGFLLFQLAYTFVGFVFVGLSRQWTGSSLYFAANHIAINWMACTA
jgi:membrane protease YdiL (CAAX protease family)